MRINEIISEKSKKIGIPKKRSREFHEDISNLKFQPKQVSVMKYGDNDINTDMDDPSTPTLVRNKQTKNLEVVDAGQKPNKAQYDAVDMNDERKQKQIQAELKKQQQKQEREKRKAELEASRKNTQSNQLQAGTNTGTQ